MADEHTPSQPQQPAYEPPAVESVGSAEELAKGNEGSTADGTVTE
jgi:hypothetical protein